MSIKVVKAGGGAVMVPNTEAVEAGQPVTVGGVVCIQGVDSQSADGRRNAYYPNESTVFLAAKATATDLSADDAEVFYDTVNKLAVSAAGENIVKVGRKMAGLVGEVGGTTNDDFVQFIGSQR